MALFSSTHINKVDRKGRCSVPSAFRAILSAKEQQGFHAHPSFKHHAIDCLGADEVEALWKRINALDPYSDEREQLIWSTISSGQDVQIDPDGRIVLSEALRDYARIDGEVAFVGMGPSFQIWNPTTFEETRQQAFANARNAAMALRGTASTGGGSGT
ncbi:MAG: division/cell wall cluster transcriptional repressor MraZ [Rhodospirillaceae bacterium]|nr:division/cell wall cluster transcriptional repressor MraZ [Rhodospirillaceae bacterium]